jgi:hypothetical protein
MLEAINEAEMANQIYFSPRFNDEGKHSGCPCSRRRRANIMSTGWLTSWKNTS